ncbi:hypothetical protein [Polaribacter glomeratus]|uniref:Uncharacterized protein n=1 Tax=Polaribacter glomeratus TaxID=102 RepID=A0A2S7WIN2_9FLAO|nr:hypothetical protein [Polaribacter glomeratus]PQJ77468.1 hypothetical protein BTO16_16730 [Polaribacter glomeratus]TXD66057.1 hypothetical protein ESX12_07825 [Polaribacter glomeratus]
MSVFKIPKVDLKKIVSVFIREIGLFVFMVFVLFFDSIYFSENVKEVQNILNFLMIVGFFIMYFRTVKRVQELMIYAVIIGFLGEYFFSKYLGMYTYRLENIPLYVPFGHAVLFARVFRFSKVSLVRKYHKSIEQFFGILILLFASIYLLFFADIFGFVMTICVFLLLWKRPKDRLFFFTMYFLVAILEIGGTAFGCWKWPNIAFDSFEFLPSNNPPSGISLFYFLLDVGCFVMYTQRNKMAWFRLKNSRKLNS